MLDSRHLEAAVVADSAQFPQRVRFGAFEADLRAGELWKSGRKRKLTGQPFAVLAILLERPGEVISRDELQKRLWPDTFVDVDHNLNTAINKIREALNDSPEQPRFVETLSRRGYRFIAPVEGVQPAAPPGLNGTGSASVVTAEEANVGANASVAAAPSETAAESRPVQAAPLGFPIRARVAGWSVAAVVVLTAALFSGLHVVKGRSLRGTQPEIHSLAVLPLDNLSGDAGQEYFADGMTDELTTMLAKDSTLRLVSRTSVMQYKGVHRPLREIAQALGVDGVVEGSVERTGDTVHMTLQLIQGPSDTHMWAESYDRNANDLVSLPDEAARAIAKKTESAVSGRAPARYVSPEAHDAYLHGRYLWYVGANEEAAKYFKRAVDLQPDYAAAWTGISDYYGAGMNMGELDPRQNRAPFEAAAQKAVDLDDSLPEAHNTLCAAMYISQWNLARADRECTRAIDLDPRFAEAYHLRAKVLLGMHRVDEAIASQKKAMELDPFARPFGLASIYWGARRYDAALIEGRQRLESDPHNESTLHVLADIYRCKGMFAEAAQAWEDSLVAEGKQADAASIRREFARGGYRAVLLWNLADLKKQSLKHYVSPVDIAQQYSQLGMREETLSELEEAYRQHSPQLIDNVQEDPAYDFLHSDERYRSLMRRVGPSPAY